MPQPGSEEVVEVFSRQAPANTRPRGSALAWLSTLLALAALAAFAWQWRETDRHLQEIRELVARQAGAAARPAVDPSLAADITELRQATARAEARSAALEQQQQALREALESDGHSIVAANGGEAGIGAFHSALARGEGFDAVFTDLGMPYVDGRKVAAAIKEASADTPVILLSGWGQRLVAEGEAPPHVDRVLAKPPKLRELREALATLCPRHDPGAAP